uniref:Reverse transcriptase domain-containing protein n=1 Tax=Trichogramma kaykai TaxID=54128 RepID=A0ABD2WI71_9HYME
MKVITNQLETPEDDAYELTRPTEIDYDLYSDPEDFTTIEPTDHIPESRIFTIQEDLTDLIKIDHLYETERQYIHKLIHEYKNIFHMPGETLPGTSKVEHKIITTDDDPINVKQYKYAHALKDEVNKQVQEMLDSNVTEKSDSPYNNPLWIVEKKPDSEGNKRWRIVLDFRALNDKTISDAYPLPNITEIFDQVGSAKYYSVLDLSWGFWQIRLDPRDAHKCAFSTPFEIKEAVDEGQNAVDDQADLSVLPSTSTLQNIDCMEYEQKDEQIHNDELTISTESCVLPDDPLLELPKNRLEKSVRISRGPYQPILTKFPVKITGTGNDKRKRSFSTLWYKEFNPLSPNRTFF